MKLVYEMHRSDAITVLLKVCKHPQLLTNIEMAEELEDKFPTKDRSYLVREDDIELSGKVLTPITF